MSYDQLIEYLKTSKYKTAVRSAYVVINTGKGFHVSVFRDQWDEYSRVIGLPYHLFHITSESHDSDKCSSYFWVGIDDLKITEIPSKYFMYEQDNYGFISSTRRQCDQHKISKHLDEFQKILNTLR
jgi:hypothetical protein